MSSNRDRAAGVAGYPAIRKRHAGRRLSGGRAAERLEANRRFRVGDRYYDDMVLAKQLV